METLRPSYDQLSKGVTHILAVTSKQRNETYKIATHAEALRKENVSLQDAVKSQKRSWQESEQDRASLAINLKLARAELVAEEQRRREVDTKRRDAEARCRILENQVSLIRELVLSDKQRRSMLSEHELQELNILRPANDDICAGDASEIGLSRSIDPSNSDLSLMDEDGSLLRSGRKWRRSILQQTYQEEGESEDEPASPPRKRAMAMDSLTRTQQPSSSTPKAAVAAAAAAASAAVATKAIDFSPPSMDHVLDNPKRRQAPQPPGKRPPTRHSPATDAFRGSSALGGGNEPSAPPYEDLFPDNAMSEEAAPLPLKSSLRRQPSTASIQTLVESRPHEFTKKSVMTRETCSGCQSNIKFASAGLKCKDCRIICHEGCRENCPLPCVPIAQTPQTKKTIVDGTLESYAPRRPPFVPSLVVHCAKEVEKRGVSEVGIYRLSGKDKSVKDLKVKLLKGTRTGAGLVTTEDINVVSCTLKLFLRELKEPLLPAHFFRAFFDATEVDARMTRDSMLHCSIRSLPTANQHTLSYIILHLMRVSEQCSSNKMTISNMVKVFAPTMVGTQLDQTPQAMLADLNRQQAILEALFDLDPSFYTDILNSAHAMAGDGASPSSSPTGSPLNSPRPPIHQQQLIITPSHLRASSRSGDSPVTPETKQAPEIASVLGPITASAQKRNISNQTPRRAVRKRPGGFFASVKGSAV